jgi:tetratricopeptide (TPR) repeat protein
LARSAAGKALAIDSSNREARSVLAVLAAICDHDWKTAEKDHRTAMTAEPLPPVTRFRYAAFYLLPLGHVIDAMEQCRLGLDTDPLSMILHYAMARSLFYAKQYQESVEYARKALEMDANYYLLWFAMGLAQLYDGLTLHAIASLQRVVELAPWWYQGLGYLAAAYHQAGDCERGSECARKLTESHAGSCGAAAYYAATGEVDAMFGALDNAYRRRDRFLVHIKDEPFIDPYRADPRFQSLLAKMNLG